MEKLFRFYFRDKLWLASFCKIFFKKIGEKGIPAKNFAEKALENEEI